MENEFENEKSKNEKRLKNLNTRKKLIKAVLVNILFVKNAKKNSADSKKPKGIFAKVALLGGSKDYELSPRRNEKVKNKSFKVVNGDEGFVGDTQRTTNSLYSQQDLYDK